MRRTLSKMNSNYFLCTCTISSSHFCRVFHGAPITSPLPVKSKPIIWCGCPSNQPPLLRLLLSLDGPRVIFANELLCCCHGNRPITTECKAGVAPLTPTHKNKPPRMVICKCIMQCYNPHPPPSPSHLSLFVSSFFHVLLSFTPLFPQSSIPSGLITSSEVCALLNLLCPAWEKMTQKRRRRQSSSQKHRSKCNWCKAFQALSLPQHHMMTLLTWHLKTNSYRNKPKGLNSTPDKQHVLENARGGWSHRSYLLFGIWSNSVM